MSVHFVNITQQEFLNEKVPLFKIVPVNRLVSTLGPKHYLWFANPKIWDDPFEKRFIVTPFKTASGNVDYPLKDQIYCCCFSEIRVCEAQWKIYSSKCNSNQESNQESILLSIKKDVLLNELEDYCKRNSKSQVYIGRVKYQETSTIEGSLSKNPFLKSNMPLSLKDHELLIKLLLLKRNAFLFENEIRIFIINSQLKGKNGIPFDYQCNAPEMFSRVSIDKTISNSSDLKKWLESPMSTTTTYGAGLGFTTIKDSLNRKYPRVVFSHLYVHKHPKIIKI